MFKSIKRKTVPQIGVDAGNDDNGLEEPNQLPAENILNNLNGHLEPKAKSAGVDMACDVASFKNGTNAVE